MWEGGKWLGSCVGRPLVCLNRKVFRSARDSQGALVFGCPIELRVPWSYVIIVRRLALYYVCSHENSMSFKTALFFINVGRILRHLLVVVSRLT